MKLTEKLLTAEDLALGREIEAAEGEFRALGLVKLSFVDRTPAGEFTNGRDARWSTIAGIAGWRIDGSVYPDCVGWPADATLSEHIARWRAPYGAMKRALAAARDRSPSQGG